MMARERNYERYADLKHHKLRTLEEVLNASPEQGLYTYTEAGETVDFIYEAPTNNSGVILVCFASASGQETEAPKIEGRTFASRNGMSLLAFADPSVSGNEKLTTNYALGNLKHDFHQSVEKIVRHFAGNDRIIFFGVSGGGFPALKLGSKFPESLSCVINPRVNILVGKTNFRVNKRHLYPRLSFAELGQKKSLSISEAKNTVLYIQNIGDENYFGFQMVPYMLRFGQLTHVWSILGNWGKGHKAMPGDERSALMKVLLSKSSWQEALELVADRYPSLESLQEARADFEISNAYPSQKVLDIADLVKGENKVNSKEEQIGKIYSFLESFETPEPDQPKGFYQPQIVGDTKFSVFTPNSEAYKASNGSRFSSDEEYLEYLYSDERLLSRSRMFFTLSLPQIAYASVNTRFTHVVSYSENLPSEYKALLKKAEETYDFLQLEELPVGSSPAAARRIALEAISPGEAVGIFRIDDDDILGKEYFNIVEKYVTSGLAGMRVSLPSGFVAIWTDEKVSFVREAYRPLISIGMLSILAKDAEGNILEAPSAPHKTADRFGPVVLDSTTPSFVWLRHDQQDTELNRSQATDPIQRLRKELTSIGSAADRSILESHFPALVPVLAEEKLHVLLKDRVQIGRQLEFALPQLAGNFDLKFNIRTGEGADPRNLIVTLALQTPEGAAADKEIDIPNFRKHPNDEVGYFQVVRLKKGLRSYKVSVTLPDGVHCSAIALRKYKRPETRIDVYYAAASQGY